MSGRPQPTVPRQPTRRPHGGPPTASSLLPTLDPGVALLSLLTRHRLPGPRHRTTTPGTPDPDGTTAPPAPPPRTRV
ncbi:hypothetical protein G3I20_10230 [Streptomyces sp. SID8111]|nr:hypothetical protein [Streptomyces sp. SID8111]